MHYLLDTNICIYLIKKRPPEVLDRFRQHPPQDVAISTITLFELEYGGEKSQYRVLIITADHANITAMSYGNMLIGPR